MLAALRTFYVTLSLSVPVVLLKSPNVNPYVSLNKLERTLLLIFSSLLNSRFLTNKSLILCVLFKEKLGVDKWLGLKRVALWYNY